MEALPDTVERLWTGALEGPHVPAEQKAKGKSKDLVQEKLQVGPKFGMTRLALHSGQAVLREVVCAVLEASGTGERVERHPLAIEPACFIFRTDRVW